MIVATSDHCDQAIKMCRSYLVIGDRIMGWENRNDVLEPLLTKHHPTISMNQANLEGSVIERHPPTT